MLEKPAFDVVDTPPAQVKRWQSDGGIVLVDVRETSEFERAHIPGALLLPLSSFDADMFPRFSDKKVVLYCAIGKRSAAAGKMLGKAGFGRVFNIAGGLEAWKAAGLEVEENPAGPAPGDEPSGTPSDASSGAPAWRNPAPGAVLKQDYLDAFSISPTALARALRVDVMLIEELIAGRVALGIELSMRLARFFCTAPDFWARLQMDHDIERAGRSLGARIAAQVQPCRAGASPELARA